MAEVIKYIFYPTIISILIIIPEILFDKWLCKIGVSRDSKTEIVLATFTLVFLKQFLFENLSWWISGIAILFAGTLAVHRFDFSQTMNFGKWWWEREPEKKKKKRSKSK